MRNYKTIGDINDIKGFFEKYSEIKPENFNELFENATSADIQTMDFILSDLYGSKVLLSKYADMFENSGADVTMQRIVLIADKMCFENWKAIKESIETALTQDMEKPLKSVKSVSSEKTGENATENKVNAFDSETASDSDNSSHNYTDNVETTETTSYSNGKTASENAKKFIDFVNNNDFIENIIKDVLNVSCIDVFDDNYICGRSSGSSGGSGEIADLKNRIEEIESVIPENATPQNKLVTIADVQSGYDDTEIRGEINENINGIYDDLTEYAKKDEIPDVSGLATKSELQSVENSIPDVSGLATKSELQSVENAIPDVSGLATKSELQSVENAIPDVSGLATKTEVQAITDLIPSNATTQNKLATMSDIPSGSGGSVPLYKETSQYSIPFSHILSGAGKTLADLPLTIKIDFAGTYNNNNVYDSCIFELSTFDGGTQSTGTIHEMAKSSSVKFWKYANSIVVSGSTNDNVYAVGTYLFTVF